MAWFVEALQAVGITIACVVLDGKRLDEVKDAEATSRRLKRGTLTGWAAASGFRGYIPSSDQAMVSMLRLAGVNVGEGVATRSCVLCPRAALHTATFRRHGSSSAVLVVDWLLTRLLRCVPRQ
jgi:hypothetical protein